MADLDRPTSVLITGPAAAGKTAEVAATARAHHAAGGLVWWAGDVAYTDPDILDWHEHTPHGTAAMIEVAARLAEGRLSLSATTETAAGPLLLIVDPWPARTDVAGRLGWLAQHGPTGTTPIDLLATAKRTPADVADQFAGHLELPHPLPL
jgi:hypothetical protein